MHRMPVTVTCACAMLLTCLRSLGHGQDDFLSINMDREKQLIEGHMRECSDMLAAVRLQQARAALRLVDDRLALISKNLDRAERQSFSNRIASLNTQMRHIEDSLVTVVREKFAAEGLDAAIDYSQQVLRRLGLSEQRFKEVDAFLMAEAPRDRQRREASAIERAVQSIEQGRGVPRDIDPYLAMTAKQIAQDRRDSLRTAQQTERRARRTAESDTEREEAAAARAQLQREEQEQQALLEQRQQQLQQEEQEQQALRERRQQQLQREERELAALREQRQPEQADEPIDAPPLTFREAEEPAAVDTAALRRRQEAERQARIEAARREETRVAAIERLNRGESPFHETSMASGSSASVREYLQQRAAEEKKAQEVAVHIYNLLERNRNDEALSLFRNRRDYLAEHISKEVFVVLERSVVTGRGEEPAAVPAAAATSTAPPTHALPREEQIVQRIRQYFNERRWGPAVSLFDGSKRDLRNYLSREEYRKLAAMVDSAREYVKK